MQLVYEELKSDAENTVSDLRGGVAMWREAAGANFAAAGFVFILALTTFHYGPAGHSMPLRDSTQDPAN